jgi:DNA-binding NtrC family response regulator
MHNSKKLSMESFIKAMGRSVKESLGSETVIDDNLLTFHERLPTLKKSANLLVMEAIKRTKGNQSMAARLLGITQPALSSRLKKVKK